MYIKVDHPLRKCQRCASEFKPRTSHQNFCSKRCYKAWGRKHKGHLGNNLAYRKYKESTCSKCNFIAVSACQLDVDHIDGNHKNNNFDNLQTLCANCHRLKTHAPHLF